MKLSTIAYRIAGTWKQPVSFEQAKELGDKIGINWGDIDINEFRRGIEIEMEHGDDGGQTDVIGHSLEKAARIALAHLLEVSDYYTKLDKYVESPTTEDQK